MMLAMQGGVHGLENLSANESNAVEIFTGYMARTQHQAFVNLEFHVLL